MRFIGLLVGLAGVTLAVRSATLLAGRGRPRRGPSPAFVIAGPYVRVRNPLYGGAVLAVVGFALWHASTLLLLLGAALGFAAHSWVVRVEEPALRRRFGDAYEAYLRCVPRWVPSKRRAPA